MGEHSLLTAENNVYRMRLINCEKIYVSVSAVRSPRNVGDVHYIQEKYFQLVYQNTDEELHEDYLNAQNSHKNMLER